MKTAAAIRASQGAERIRKLNQLYWRSVADIDMMKRISAISKEREQQELIEIGNQHIDREHRKILSRFAFTDNILASINDPAPMTRVSSAYSKDRGHWMASLATSGACPGWTSVLTNSADGAWWHFAPVSDPRDEEIWDMGFSVTETELSDVFEAGKYFATRAPAPSPYDQNTVDASPQEKQDALQIAARRTVDEIGQHDDRWRIPRPKATILRQSVFSKVTEKAGSDKEAIRVKITNAFTDGRAETKEIVDDTRAVLREVERAVGDISDRNNGLDQESYEETQEGRDSRLSLIAMVDSATSPDEVVLGTDIEGGTENA